ncbi:MAG TPA: hypothetical protein EYG51_03410 [Pseudomonadales bacterium]|jgi:hypothetical protein|nr:hypothetical protein [Pseudomonadales bacterium]
MKHLAVIILTIGLIMAVQPSAAQKLKLPNIGGVFGAMTKILENFGTPLILIADNCATSKTKGFFPELVKAADKSKYAVLIKDRKIAKMVAVCKKRIKQKRLNTKSTEGIFVVIDKVLRMTKKERAAVRVLAPSDADIEQFVGSLK